MEAISCEIDVFEKQALELRIAVWTGNACDTRPELEVQELRFELCWCR
jgi:hypothetical protein